MNIFIQQARRREAMTKHAKAFTEVITSDDDNELYEYFESSGLPIKKIETMFGSDVLDGYMNWVYFNIK